MEVNSAIYKLHLNFKILIQRKYATLYFINFLGGGTIFLFPVFSKFNM